jgi:hypothetical protein
MLQSSCKQRLNTLRFLNHGFRQVDLAYAAFAEGWSPIL